MRGASHIVDALIEVDVEACAIRDIDGDSPLHIAMMGELVEPERIVSSLLQAHPQGASVANNEGNLPIHLACQHAMTAETLGVVASLLAAFPESAEMPDSGGKLALQLVCSNDAASEEVELLPVISILLEAHKEAAAAVDSQGNVPLHLAIEYLSSRKEIEQIVSLLLVAHKEAAAAVDSHGNVPLHLAIEYLSSREEIEQIVSLLLTMHPQSASMAANDGRLAIHFAAQFSTDVRVLQAVIKANEAALRIVSSLGSVMHCALQSRLNSTICNFLHALDPTLIAIRDNQGRTPLHLAAKSGFRQLQLIFSYDPSAASAVDNQGELVLHHFLKKFETSHIYRYHKSLLNPLSEEAKSLRLLLKAYPQGAAHLDNDGHTPYSFRTRNMSFYAHRLLLTAAPSLDPDLLHQVNYEARRQLLFLTFAAVQGGDTLLRRLRKHRDGTINVVRYIASFC